MSVRAIDEKLASQEVSTRLKIVEAMESLLSQTTFDKITVSAICKEAGVSRQTFYRYFDDKVDVTIWLEATIAESYLRRIGDTLTWKDAIEMLLIELPGNAARLPFATTTSSQRSDFMRRGIQRLSEFLLYELGTVRGVPITTTLAFQCRTYPLVLMGMVDLAMVDQVMPALSNAELAAQMECYVPHELREAFCHPPLS